MSRTATKSLDNLRLPELQARYAEIIGESTRCPNRKYLISRITEALAAQPKQAKAKKQKVKNKRSEADEAVMAPEPTDINHADAELRADEDAMERQHSNVTDELAKRADDARSATERDASGSADEELTDVEGEGDDKPLRKMSIAELQQRYLDVVGRPTGSSHRRYLIWKIREAQKGKVPVGPRNRRNPGEPAPEYMILPVRMEADLAKRLDDARERLGLRSRMDLFRQALATYLGNVGETELAAALMPAA